MGENNSSDAVSDRETRPVSWLFFTESKSKRFRACGGPVVKIKRLTPDWWATVGAFEARLDVEVDDSNRANSRHWSTAWRSAQIDRGRVKTRRESLYRCTDQIFALFCDLRRRRSRNRSASEHGAEFSHSLDREWRWVFQHPGGTPPLTKRNPLTSNEKMLHWWGPDRHRSGRLPSCSCVLS